eukprot:m.195284 g.195284  ORF g.195284 m.195284 type:complete len:1099 (-) comp17001_c0_seq1:878-4174(-)
MMLFSAVISLAILTANGLKPTTVSAQAGEQLQQDKQNSELIFWNETPTKGQEPLATTFHKPSLRHRRADSKPQPQVSVDTLDDLKPSAIIHWDAAGSDNVYSVTQQRDSDNAVTSSTLYISTNDGVRFDAVTNVNVTKALIDSFYPSPHDIGHIIFVDKVHRTLILTEDSGFNFTVYPVPFSPDEIDFNDGIDGLIYARDSTTNRLYLSSTRGKNWSSAVNDGDNEHHVISAVWSATGYGSDSTDTLYLEIESDSNPTSSSLLRIPSALAVANGSVSSQGVDVTPSNTVVNSGSFLLANNYMFFETGPAGNRALYVSYNRTNFVKAEFSGPDLESDYTVVDASEDEVFVAVRHSNISNLYISDRRGTGFSLSLESIVYSTQYNLIDFYRVASLEGVYIATQVDPITRYGQTVITFDKGAQWRPIEKPLDDSCSSTRPEDCRLQLHLDYSSYYLNVRHETVVSSKAAPGYILAVGNTGASLSRAINTYISNDGGLSWRKAFSGDKHINILDHGGVLVAAHAADQATYDSIHFSVDRGLSWIDVNINQKLVFVALLVEPGESNTMALLWGYPRTTTSQWTIVAIDFKAALNQRECEDTDFEVFTPRDPASPLPCVLGRRESFKRRKVDSLCVIGDGNSYDEPVSTAACECVAADYECDFGFERLALDQACRPTALAVVPRCIPGQNITISKGYRRVPDDGCEGGLSLVAEPITYKCPELCPVGEWSVWSDCDPCQPDGFQFRSRNILQADVDPADCPCTYERRSCPQRSLGNSVQVLPSLAHFAVNEPVVLAAVLVDAECQDGNSFGRVDFSWSLGTTAYSPSTATLVGDTLDGIKLTQAGAYSAVLTASNRNSSSAFSFDLIAFESSAFLTITYALPVSDQTHSYATALTEQFQATLVASGLAKPYRLVDDVSNSLQGQTAVLTFRLLNVDGSDGFFDAALTLYQRAASNGDLNVVFNSQTIKATKVQLTSTIQRVTTTPAPRDETSKSGSNHNSKYIAGVVVVVIVAALVVGAVVVLSRRKMKRFEQTYGRLQHDVMEQDEDDEAMLMNNQDDDATVLQIQPQAGTRTHGSVFVGGARASIQADTTLHDSDDFDDVDA